MKASLCQQQLLLDLQDLDNTLARLRRRLQQLPERARLEELQSEADAAKQAYLQGQRELDTYGAEIGRLEDDIATVRARRERDEQRLAVSTSPKEAQALQSEIETLERRQLELEDRELELMEAREEVQARFADASARLESVEARRTELKAAASDAETEITRLGAEAQRERTGLTAEIQRDLLDLYERIRERGGVGAARLRGNVSEASNMALTPAELSELRAAAPDDVVFCPQSGAILVREFADREG